LSTIKDVAKRSNVSISTVSRVLNNDLSLSVSEETRQRIFEVAKELNYINLKKKKSNKEIKHKELSIGIILCHSIEEEANDPFFLDIRKGIENECKTKELTAIELFRFNNLTSDAVLQNLDGLIVVGNISPDELNKICTNVKNVVYINFSPNEERYDSVIIDYEKATNKVLDHLIQLGYSRIGYIGGQDIEIFRTDKKIIEDKRHTTFIKRMKKENLYNSDFIFLGEYSMQHGYDLMKEALRKQIIPEAFFIGSDPMAIGALRALQEEKLKVPEDVAIVGFDDIQMAKFASTPLTTIRVYTEEMGRLGVNLLLDKIKGRTIPLKVSVPTELVIRESCGFHNRSIKRS
jgi:LacI family transcriptional regulator